MPISLSIDGQPHTVERGTTVAAAIAIAGGRFRRSAGGEWRGPLCGMGVCMECRVTIDGEPHSRSCQMQCRNGMEIRTDGR
ncbi:MAG: (2Fe-2S)-binding protein [Bryobacteraceae bacterium]